jgi:hypothetical protein
VRVRIRFVVYWLAFLVAIMVGAALSLWVATIEDHACIVNHAPVGHGAVTAYCIGIFVGAGIVYAATVLGLRDARAGR